MIANEINPDENPREDAALVAAYCHLLDHELSTEIYSTVLVNLSCMNHSHRIYLIDLAKQVKYVQKVNYANWFARTNYYEIWVE